MILIKNAAQIVTASGSAPKTGASMRNIDVIRNADILIKNDKILKIGRNIVAKNAEIINAKNMIVMPGFVDAHTHLIFSGTREFEVELKRAGKSYLEIQNSGGGINYTVKKTRAASKETLKEEARARIKNMVIHGTTTAEAKSGYGLNYKTERKMLEAINELDGELIELVPTFMGAHLVPEEYEAEEYIDYLLSYMPKIAKLARFIDVFCDKGAFSAAQSKRYLDAGIENGMVPKLHADELGYIGCSRLAAEIKAISADHLLKTPESIIRKMSKNKTIAVLMPATPYMLFSREYADARKFIENNVPVALGSDLNPNCYTENMQMVISLALTQMKMSIEEAITAATLNAASAIGMADKIGSLEIGKQADIIILDVPDYRFLGYHFGVNLVNGVIKKGKIIAKDQKVQYL
jgi:imidazolonepropionase